MKSWSYLCLGSMLLFVLASAGCTDDSSPRTVNSGGFPSNVGESSSSGNGDEDDADAGTDDANDDEQDDVHGRCELEPNSQPVDPRFPCCFDDQDCRESGLPGADSMYCYYAECTEDGEGSCRIPPQNTHQCWDDYDCPEGYSCPHELNADSFYCRHPQTIENPATCVEDDS